MLFDNEEAANGPSQSSNQAATLQTKIKNTENKCNNIQMFFVLNILSIQQHSFQQHSYFLCSSDK